MTRAPTIRQVVCGRDPIRPRLGAPYDQRQRASLHSPRLHPHSMFLTRVVQTACLLLVGFAVLSCSPSRADLQFVYAKTKTRLNFRSGPSLHDPILYVFEKDERLPILEGVGSWYKVRYRNRDGYVAASYVTLIASDRSPGPMPSARLNMRREYAEVLEQAGWLHYVEGNIDRIYYVPANEFLFNGESVLGTARIMNDERLVHVAIRGWDAEDIAAVLVHEAAHEEDYARRGVLNDDAYAESVEDRFREDLEDLERQQANAWVNEAETIPEGANP